MKILKQIIILLLSAGVLTSCSVPNNSGKNTGNEAPLNYINTAPAVTAEMNNPDYWISKYDDADKLLMDAAAIRKISMENEPAFAVGNNKKIKFSSISNTIEGSYVKTLLDGFTVPDSSVPHYKNGEPVPSDYWDMLIENMNRQAVGDIVNVAFGFTVKRSDLKATPTSDFISDSATDLHYDSNAIAECAPYEAVAVLHKSLDQKWYFVAAYGYAGWIPAENVALCKTREEWLSYQDSTEFLVVTAREIRLAYDPYDADASGLLIPMGTKLPLVKPADAPADFNGRTNYNSYTVKVPGRLDNGYIEYKYILIPVSSDVSIGYLPYTRENIISQAFKRLGDRYGWAGMYSANDCSGISREIYKCFGFDFPRNGKAQVTMTGMNAINAEKYTDKEKLVLLSELPAGSLLYFPGHLMIYLGMDNRTPYVISAVGNMATADMPEGTSTSVNSVIINSLTDTTRKTGDTWLSCITLILNCEYK